jgi:serine/threonine-protein kinase
VIEAMIGQGGMGAVFRAHDTRLRRLVALKVLTGSFPTEARALLLREARIAATLNHPNIVMVFDVGEVEGVPFMAMELLDGLSLRHYVKNPPPMPQRLRWLLDMARGLEVAHRAGLVHRDIKPGNVFVTADGAKVLDFGVAKPTEAARANYTAPMPAVRTVVGSTSGTPRYMAPEQLFHGAVDPRADQYSWALTAYELITGVPARDPSWSPATAFDLPSMEGIAPRVADVLRRALDPYPAQRLGSMAEIASALVPMCGSREATMEFQAIMPEPNRAAPEARTRSPVSSAATRKLSAPLEPPDGSSIPAPDQAPVTERTPAPLRTPDRAHLEPLVECALADLAREVGDSFREASVIVTVDAHGGKARYFVLIVAVDDAGALRVIRSSIDSLRACGHLIGADARAGNGRWKRIVVPIGPRGLDPAARIDLT